MRPTFLPICALALALAPALAACDSDDGGGESGPQAITGGFDSDYRTSAEWFTSMAGPKLGASPHGTVQIWYTTNIQSLIGTAGFTVPVGTTAIKEVDSDSDGTLDALAVMVKQEAGYDATNGDWYYEMRMTDGTVMATPAPGPVAMCIGCHAAAKATDYLAGTTLE